MRAGKFKIVDRFADPRFRERTVEVDVKHVFVRLIRERARFDFRHVDSAVGEGLQRVRQRAGLMRNGENDRRDRACGRLDRFAGEYVVTGQVRALAVFDIVFEDGEVMITGDLP